MAVMHFPAQSMEMMSGFNTGRNIEGLKESLGMLKIAMYAQALLILISN